MRKLVAVLLLTVAFQGARAEERLGLVAFPTSCAAPVRAAFNRGVALLHDFWYEEARRQFEDIAIDDPKCAMAHWGIAMSQFHQIWNRPDKDAMVKGRAELKRALASPPSSARERAYIAALGRFYAPLKKEDYQKRVDAYAAAMAALYHRYPKDVDAGAFYALAVLASEPNGDTSLRAERQAEAVLEPLFKAYPNHPGVAHYLIHACDTPSLAPEGLAAAQRYGVIAPSGAHAAHMPGHIFARLGMWQEDIAANLAAVADSHAAQSRHADEGFDQFHANEFLLYAYLQSGQEARAKQVVEDNEQLVVHIEAMPSMAKGPMSAMFAMYRSEFPAFYYLEMRDWNTASALPVDVGARPATQLLTYWARIVAQGHLKDAAAAQADVAQVDALMEQVKKSDRAYIADSTWVKVARGELLGWAAYAAGDEAGALKYLRDTADLQDRVGQGEVDIPAREMLADLLLASNQPAAALIEYEQALKLSPNRFNGLFNAGLAAEAVGDRAKAAGYYAMLLKVTDNGTHSARSEYQHVKDFNAPATAAR
jgi:tetratricopeptide (TPR) repeat protein